MEVALVLLRAAFSVRIISRAYSEQRICASAPISKRDASCAAEKSSSARALHCLGVMEVQGFRPGAL